MHISINLICIIWGALYVYILLFIKFFFVRHCVRDFTYIMSNNNPENRFLGFFFNSEENSGLERLLLTQIHIANKWQRTQTQTFRIPGPHFFLCIFYISGWGILPKIYKNGSLRWFNLIIYKICDPAFFGEWKRGIH